MSVPLKSPLVNALNTYLDQLRETPLLTLEQEKELTELIWQTNDQKAKQTLIMANLRLVVSVAKRYCQEHGKSLTLEIIQRGNEGLVCCVDKRKFDPTRGFKFSTYVTRWIWEFIVRTAIKEEWRINLPVHLHQIIAQYRRAENELTQISGKTPSAPEMSSVLGIPLKEVLMIQRAIELTSSVLSLEKEVPRQARRDHNPLTYEDIIPDQQTEDPEETAQRNMLKEAVTSELTTLDEREVKILFFLYGVNKTMEEIGNLFNLSRERIRQIAARALKKLSLNRKLRKLAGVDDNEAP